MPSDLQITNIRDLNNANSAITIGLDGQITVNQNNPTITLGSNATISKSGMIVNSGAVQNSTRTSVSGSSSTDRELLDIGDFNKLNSNTKLIIQVMCPAFGFDHAGAVSIGLKYGSSTTQWGGSFYYTVQPYSGFIVAYFYSSSHTTTGTQAISLRSGVGNSTSQRPCLIINPNSTDDSRSFQLVTTAVIYEVV